MFSDWRTWLILGILGLSFFLNVMALSRIDGLRSDLRDVRRDAAEVYTLRAQLSDAEQRISEIAEDRDLVTNVRWEIADSGDIDCANKVPVKATWTFREIPIDAEVQMELSRRGNEGWIQIPAEQVGNVDFMIQHEIAIDEDWEFRIVAQGERETLVSEPAPANELRQFTDQRVMFEEGESRSMDGKRWVRYIISPVVPRVSPCNEIVAASLTLTADGEAISTAEFAPDYPGDHPPDGFDGEDAQSPGTAFDIGLPAPGLGVEPNLDAYWWSDWIETDGPVDHKLMIEFGDGTVRTIERIGVDQ